MGVRSPFGRVLAAVRVDRDLTLRRLSERAGVALTVLGRLERGARVVDVDLLATLTAALDLTPDERRRLATAWGVTGATGGDVRYEVRPAGDVGHQAAALVAAHAGDLTDETWSQIAAAVRGAVDRRAAA